MLVSGELAAGFGHDVFNKMTALELEARNAVSANSDHELRANRILDLVLDLKGTVQAFQQFLRKKEKIEPVNCNEVLERSKLLIRAIALKQKTSMIMNLAPELPAMVGNATFLQQAFVNIMLNAIQQMALKSEKFAWNGKRTLEISSTMSEGMLQIRFKDNGPGIHKDHLDKNLFTPGFSTRNGSGLGLYIALSFIQALGGTLLVEETFVPLGSTFLITLPVWKQEEIL
jgi:signal transduction histidine kinase